MAFWSTVPIQASGLDRLDAEYFHPEYIAAEEAVRSMHHRTLGELAGYIKRGTQPDYADTGILPVLRSVNVQSGAISTARQEFVSSEFFISNPRGQVGEGDVLINSTGLGTLGRVAHIPTDTQYFADGHITIVRQLSGVDPFYLVVFLLSDPGQKLLRRRQRGSSGQVELYADDIATIPVPIPSLALRAAISRIEVQRTEAMALARVHSAEAAALINDALRLEDTTFSIAKTYTASLREAVSAERLDAEHFNPQNARAREYLINHFEGRPLGSLGKVLKGSTPTEYVPWGVPVIRSGDLVDLDQSEDFLHADAAAVRFDLEHGDVLMSSIGMGSIGKVQVFEHNTRHTTVSEVTVVRQTRLNPHFLKAFLSSPLGQVQIESWVTGATGQLHLRPTDVEKIIVPTVIPVEVQSAFEKLNHTARTRKEKARELLEHAIERVEALVSGG